MVIHPVMIRIPHRPGLVGPQFIERQREFARIALDHSAKLSGAPAGPWPFTPDRVPLPRDRFHWSISHKPRFAAAVISPVAVGIDIESITPRGRDLSPAVASQEEWDLMKIQGKARQSNQAPAKETPPQENAADEPANVDWSAFFRMWTAKEAALKAKSKGIGGLKACRLSRIDPHGRFVLTYQQREFTVEHFAYAGHVAACTSSNARILWHVIEGPIGR